MPSFADTFLYNFINSMIEQANSFLLKEHISLAKILSKTDWKPQSV